MNDADILREIERRIHEWFKEEIETGVYQGWAEENAGFHEITRWIKELRENKGDAL